MVELMADEVYTELSPQWKLETQCQSGFACCTANVADFSPLVAVWHVEQICLYNSQKL